MATEKKPTGRKDSGIVLREHVYDGIQEYDQRLPNWWLFTLYGAIVFSAVYWMFYFSSRVGQTDIERLEAQMQRIQAVKLENSIDVTDDGLFWEMAGNPSFISEGETLYQQNCATCHKADLSGDIGVSLIDGEWIYGANPTQVYTTIYNGTPNGMPAWGNQLGQQKIVRVVAFLMNHHDRADIEAWTQEQAPE